MKSSYLLICLLLLFSFASSQETCTDSSSHIQYRTLQGDSLRIQKTILTKDNGKLSIGFFLDVKGRGKPFITKINHRGEVVWFKRITSPFLNGQSGFECVAEAANGNIFVSTNTIQFDNKPFFYLVFSPDGNLLFENKFGITGNFDGLGDATITTSLIAPFGADSMLFVIIRPVRFASDGMTLLTVSNNGLLGQAYTYTPPATTTHQSYYTKCKIEGQNIFLFGKSFFAKSCRINFLEQPAYAWLQIDWNTKQVIAKKAFCPPVSGKSPFGDVINNWNEDPEIDFLENGHLVYAQQTWGLDFNGGDTLTNIFKISEFDHNFTPVKSEYVCSRKKFKKLVYWFYNFYDWDCHLYIDSTGKRYISIFDILNQQIYHAVGNAAGSYLLQKQIPHIATRRENYFTRSNSIQNEPGYFSSFNILTGDDKRTYIDNFRILAEDTASPCFGTNIDLLLTKPASVSSINWPGDFTVEQAGLSPVPTIFTAEDYPLERVIVCNIRHSCDTLILHAPDTVCNISQPIIITAHKNPLCNGKINFRFDTLQVQSYSQVNDTTLSLTFNSSYKGKIYAQPSFCDKLQDSAEIFVNAPLPAINLGDDLLYCPGKKYLLNAFNTFFKNYNWQNGSNNSAYTATSGGSYYVTAMDYCKRVYSDTILIIKKDFGIHLGNDSTICKSEGIILSVPSGYFSYTWLPQYNLTSVSQNKVYVYPGANTTYSLDAEVFKGCTLSDTINIKVEDCPQYIYFPNSFTPNNDGLNDLFKPVAGGVFVKYQLQVYNRSGELVFNATDRTRGWDGVFHGILQNNGAFVWQCKYQFHGKQEKIIKGTLILIR